MAKEQAMGIFDFLGKTCVSDACGKTFAFKVLGKVKCRNMGCVNFDADYAARAEADLEKRRKASAESRPRSGNFDPGENRLEIRYRNFLDVEGTYTGDRRTLWLTNNHFSLLLVPTGKRVSFSQDSIRNLGEVEQWLVEIPTPRERQVLNYHRKKGTTSPLFEKLRQRYPKY
jgi:hypothetical protein